MDFVAAEKTCKGMPSVPMGKTMLNPIHELHTSICKQLKLETHINSSYRLRFKLILFKKSPYHGECHVDLNIYGNTMKRLNLALINKGMGEGGIFAQGHI